MMGLILNLAFYTSAQAGMVNSESEKEAKFTEKVKDGVNKLGYGKDVQVRLKMKNGTKLKGYVAQANEDNFVVIDSSGKATTISFSQVKQITGKNNLNGTKIALGVLIAIAIFAVFVLPALVD